jgi:hypothetical protein
VDDIKSLHGDYPLNPSGYCRQGHGEIVAIKSDFDIFRQTVDLPAMPAFQFGFAN